MSSRRRGAHSWEFSGRSLRTIACLAWERFNEHELMTRASAIAFYAMLALVPFLGLTLTLAVQLLPDLRGGAQSAVGIGNLTVEQFEAILKSSFPEEAYAVIKEQIARIQAERPVGLISISLLILIWLTSSLFVAVIDAMNRVHGLRETRPLWKLRLIAIIMTVVQALLLLGSLVAIVAWPQILRWMGWSLDAAFFATLIQWTSVTILVMLSFALTYYVGPNGDQKWRWVTPGILLGTLAFLAVTFAFRVYVQSFANYNETYGSLGGVMVLLFWFWLSGLILLCAVQIDQIIDTPTESKAPVKVAHESSRL